jgi:O-antigen/teichoic acid export membrane protein
VPATSAGKRQPDVDILDSGRAGLSYVRGSGLRSLAYFGAVGASIGATPLVTRHLRAVGYGRYVTVTSLLLIVAALTEGGIATLGVREFSGGSGAERREFMRGLIGLRLTLSVVGALAAVGFTLIAGYATVVVEGTAIASVGLVLANLQVTLAVPLTAALRLPWLAALDFTGPALTAAALAALVVSGAPLLPFFGAALVGYTATLALTASLVKPDVSLRPAFSVGLWRRLLGQSALFAAATALGAVYFQVVIVAMSLLTGGHQVGIFSLAFRVISVVNGIPLLLVGSAFPILLRAARDDRQRLRDATQRLLEASLLIGGFLSLLVVSAAPAAIEVLGGGEYDASVTVLRILGAGVTATFIAAVFAFSLLSLGMYRALIWINAAMVVLAAALCAALVPPEGARGAAIASLSLEVALALAYATALLGANRDLVPAPGRSARTLLALGVGFAVALTLPLSSPVAALAGVGALAVSLVVLRAFPRELLEALRPREREHL